jgi:chain length determinant protein (polysaccharide antigen chain regulator)
MSQQNSSVISTQQDAGFRDDEINLFDLLADLQMQRRWFIVPIIVCFLLALLYISMVKPVYQVKSVVKAVGEGELIELNIPQLEGIYQLDVDGAYLNAKGALLSKEYRRDFYSVRIEKLKELELYNENLSLAQNFNGFDKLFSITLSNPKKDAEQFIEVKLDLTDAGLATDFLNQYVEFALASRLQQIKHTLSNKLAAQADKLEYDASLIREKYYTGKIYRKLVLAEANQIATAVGQLNSVFSKNEVLADVKDMPLYLYGTKALKAESKALENREKTAKNLPYGEEHFIEGLPEILFKINQLKNIEIDFSKVSIAQVDEKATVPSRPIKPRKSLILALGLIAGGFLGLITALLVGAYKRYQKQHEFAEAT